MGTDNNKDTIYGILKKKKENNPPRKTTFWCPEQLLMGIRHSGNSASKMQLVSEAFQWNGMEERHRERQPSASQEVALTKNLTLTLDFPAS